MIKILFVSFILGLFILARPTYAKEAGDPCENNSDCSQGLSCIALSGTQKTCTLVQPTACYIHPNNIYNPAISKEFTCQEPQTFLQKLLSIMITLVFIVGSIYFFFTLVLGGIRWMTSLGDKTGVDSAQKQITHALVGIVILFIAFAIMKLVGSLFDIDLLNITLPTI